MAIPAYGTAGTEVLWSMVIDAQGNDATAFRFDRTDPTKGTDTYDVDDDHIITILTISFCNLDNSAFNFDLRIDHGGTPIHLLQDQELTAHGTFIWNDKFVLNAGDKLITEATASGRDYDGVCTFIDQAF